MKKFSRLLRYLVDYKLQITLYFLATLLGIIFSLFSLGMLAPILSLLFRTSTPGISTAPKAGGSFISGLMAKGTGFIQAIIDEQGRSTALIYVCVTIVVAIMLKNFFIYSAAYLLNPIRNAVLQRLRDDMFTKMLSLPIGFFSEERKGDLISRMTNDINQVELSIMATLEVFIREPFTIIFVLFSMFAISVKLTLFLLLFLPVSGLIIGRIGKSLRRSSNIHQEQLGLMLGVIEETLTGMRVVKAFNAEGHQHKRFMGINTLIFRTRNKMASRSELGSPLSETMGVLVVSVVLWYGGRLIFSNNSELSAETFIVYIALFSQIISPFKNLSTSFFNMKKGSAALERIEHLLTVDNTIKELPNAKAIDGFKNKIEFKNVRFSYGEKLILNNINLTIEKGKTIALVGSSGAGKSTLVDLIPRFHDVSSGEILIDGINVKEYKIHDIRRLIGMVSQDPILFNDTIYNNIKLGNDVAGTAEIEEAAKIANAHRFVMQKPEGYETSVGDRGTKLSGGERQRVTIARAVLKNPPILILDEATSALDTESERLVQEAINGLMKNRTCIVIAHRLSTVQHADEIIVMDQGQVVERGRHADLMQHGGVYHKLVTMQQVK